MVTMVDACNCTAIDFVPPYAVYFVAISALIAVWLLISIYLSISWQQRKPYKGSRDVCQNGVNNRAASLLDQFLRVPFSKESTSAARVLLIGQSQKSGYDDVVDAARVALSAVIGISPLNGRGNTSYSSKLWSQVSSGATSFIWTCHDCDGIALRTSVFVNKSVAHVVGSLLKQNISTGLEDVFEHSAALQSFNGAEIVIRRIFGSSGSLTAVRRDFIVVTSASVLPDGTYIIASRSIKSSMKHQSKSKQGFLRGIIHCSGFILRPAKSQNGSGCEIHFAAHLNMLGTSESMNKSVLESLSTSILAVMERINKTCSRNASHSNHTEIVSCMSAMPTDAVPCSLHTSIADTNSAAEISPESVASFVLHQGHLKISIHQADRLCLASRNALDAMRSLYAALSVTRAESPKMTLSNNSGDNGTPGMHITARTWRDISSRSDKTLQRMQGETSTQKRISAMAYDRSQVADHTEKNKIHYLGMNSRNHGVRHPDSWEILREENDVSVGELHYSDSSSVLCAYCNVKCCPSDVRNLLLTTPEKVEKSLMIRGIMNDVNATCTLQWLMYSPKGSSESYSSGSRTLDSEVKDFLVITAHDSYGGGGGSEEGFIVVSTSVDEICEENDDAYDTAPEITGICRKNNSTRCHVGLRGFVGVPDGSGGTDLTMIYDPYSEPDSCTPDWILQFKAQSEMWGVASNISVVGSTFKGSFGSGRDKYHAASSRREAESNGSISVSAKSSSGCPSVASSTPTPTPTLHERACRSSRSTSRKVLSAVVSLLRPRQSRKSKVFDHTPVRADRSSRSQSPSKRSMVSSILTEKLCEERSTPDAIVSVPSFIAYSSSEIQSKRGRGCSDLSSLESAEFLSRKRDETPLAAFDESMRGTKRLDVGCKDGTGDIGDMLRYNYVDDNTVGIGLQSDALSHSLSTEEESLTTSPAGELSSQSGELHSPKYTECVGPTSEKSCGSLQLSIEECPVSDRQKLYKEQAGDQASMVALEDIKDLCSSGFRVLRMYLGLDSDCVPSSTTAHRNDDFSYGTNERVRDIEDRSKSPSLVRSDEDVDAHKGLNIAWQHKGSRRGVSVESSMVAGSTWQAIRAVCGMRCDKQSILRLLTDDDRMGEFDDMFDFATPLLKVDERSAVRRLCFKPVWPTAPRDFLCCTAWMEAEDGSVLVCSRSVPDSLLAVQKGYVRGNIRISGYWIQPYHTLRTSDALYEAFGSSRGCKVTLVAHTELGGSLPSAVINMLSTAAPLKMMTAIADLVHTDTI